MKADNITFQSKIKLVTPSVFNNRVKNLNPKKHEVGYPWQPNTSKIGKNLYTKDILDCICVGIVDKRKAFLMHLRTLKNSKTKHQKQKGFDIEHIRRRILDLVNLESETVHAFIFGGYQWLEASKYNIKELNKIKSIFEENGIPYSIIGARKLNYFHGKYSLFYSTKEDTWYITNRLIDSEAKYADGKEMEFVGDRIAYNLYHLNQESNTPGIMVQRAITDIPDFFKNQFRQVKLCEFDEFA